jgi:hypothetical protein
MRRRDHGGGDALVGGDVPRDGVVRLLEDEAVRLDLPGRAGGRQRAVLLHRPDALAGIGDAVAVRVREQSDLVAAPVAGRQLELADEADHRLVGLVDRRDGRQVALRGEHGDGLGRLAAEPGVGVHHAGARDIERLAAAPEARLGGRRGGAHGLQTGEQQGRDDDEREHGPQEVDGPCLRRSLVAFVSQLECSGVPAALRKP